MLSSASDKAKLFAKYFSRNANLDDSGISLPAFSSGTNLKLHNISVTPTLVKNVITNLDSSKTSSPDCIPVMFLKNCKPELSYIPAEVSKMCLKESCFPDCWKVLSVVVPVFKNVGETSTTKNYGLVSLLSVVSKVFEKLVNLTSEHESDLRNNVGWGRKLLADFNAGKNQHVSFDWSITTLMLLM